MTSEEARRVVAERLERKKVARQIAEEEARLEEYEQEQIRTCNTHCADARKLRLVEESGRRNQELQETRRAERRRAREAELEKKEAAAGAMRKYLYSCMGLLWLTAFTQLPVWAAVTLALGLGVFPAAYIFRLYYPAEVAA